MATISKCKVINDAIDSSSVSVVADVVISIEDESFLIPATVVAEAAKLGLVDRLSIDTAGKMNEERIREVLGYFTQGYFGVPAYNKAQREAKKVAAAQEKEVKVDGRRKVVLYPQLSIASALRTLGHDDSAEYVAQLPADKFNLAYSKSLLNPASKLFAAHEYLLEQDRIAIAKAEAQALAELDATLL